MQEISIKIGLSDESLSPVPWVFRLLPVTGLPFGVLHAPALTPVYDTLSDQNEDVKANEISNDEDDATGDEHDNRANTTARKANEPAPVVQSHQAYPRDDENERRSSHIHETSDFTG